MSLAHLASGVGSGITGVSVVSHDNPWNLSVSYVASVLRRSPSTVRQWCMDGWTVGGRLMAKKIGGEWMIHEPRFADWLASDEAVA